VARYLAPILHADDPVLVLLPDVRYLLEKELRAQPASLQERPLGELFAAQAMRESQVILDP